eukprot:3104477-Karenia_brevis.AAC.1
MRIVGCVLKFRLCVTGELTQQPHPGLGQEGAMPHYMRFVIQNCSAIGMPTFQAHPIRFHAQVRDVLQLCTSCWAE